MTAVPTPAHGDEPRQARLDHVEFYVTDPEAWVQDLSARYGFERVAMSGPSVSGHRSVAVRQGHILLVLTQGLTDEHPATGYVASHGDGVADIWLRTSDARAAFVEAVEAGARPVTAPAEADGAITAVIEAFGDVRHTFVQRLDGDAPGALPPGLVPVAPGNPSERAPRTAGHVGLRTVDHFAVCVEAGRLAGTVDFYVSALGFRDIFGERIVVGRQAMNSRVVQNSAGDVTLTIIEPDRERDPGQIDDFLKDHGGAGIQHLAFLCEDIVRSVSRLQANGVEFLSTPDAYFELLPERMEPAGHSVSELHELSVLADEDHAGQLYQIFTVSTHPRRTFFMEVIERLGAETFGSRNIQALYEAVEWERTGGEAHA